MADLFGDSSSDDEDYVRGDEERRGRGGLFDDSSSSSDEEDGILTLNSVQRMKRDKYVTHFEAHGGNQDITDEDWVEIGNVFSNKEYLTTLSLHSGALNDRKTALLFRGLTGSSSLEDMGLHRNELSAVGVRSMVPFLQHTNSLRCLNLSNNGIQSEGFNALFRSLRNSPIEKLNCTGCGITSIEIRCIPKHLKVLYLDENNINADGCRGLAKLLRGGDATLETLHLQKNKIDDEGVEILADALQSNKSLTGLNLRENGGISNQGNIMLLKLVNDISSIEATLRSNHTLENLLLDGDEQILMHIDNSTLINSDQDILEAAGREKVIWTQLLSETRAQIAELLGVNHSLYSEIDPLHLPEVLSMVGLRIGQGELYLALKSSIAGVISTVNEKQCIRQQMAYYAAKLEELGTKLAAIEAAEENSVCWKKRVS
mmetsp:Transcript_4535/g.7682  ORF Transcript_4535/g.7682 Transcript_4535/m.7682 type:complete len:430 (+) Transcript_4535:52-1341(+)